MDQDIRFCTAADGVRIAYATVGTGPPLVKTANWLNHLEFDWESPVWRHLFRELASHHRLVRYDERGNGLSDWHLDDFSFDAMVRDLETVVDAAGLDRFSLLGLSQGCAVSLAYAVRHPQRVERLVLLGGYAAGWKQRADEEEIRRRSALVTLTREGWGTENEAYRQVFTSLYIPGGDAEQLRWFNDLQRITTSPENAARLQETFGSIDVRPLLGQVKTPTLVLHARGDGAVPFEAGRTMAAAIPGARFVPLETKSHILLEHDPAWRHFAREVRSFLGAPQLEGAGTGDDAAGERWRRADALFSRLLDLEPEARRAELARPEHADVRGQVERLLSSAGGSADLLRPGGALDGPAGRAVAGEADLPGTEGTPTREAVPLPPGFDLGQVLAGRYRLEERIGRGGMGVVFRAHDVALTRDVALKVAASGAINATWRERVLREARSAAALNHPNIVGIHDFGEAAGLPYLVLELVSGPTLAARPPRDVEQAIAVARQICRALEHAHRRGIVHRDLKPANVLWDGESGQVKLSDLGVALVAADPRITGTGNILGTPSYMAPEQALGRNVDARTDLYALGVMLYEWATGAPPFTADSPLVVVSQHVHADVVPPSRRRRGLPADWDGIIGRLLAKEPGARFASAGDLERALDRLQGPDAGGVAPAAPQPRAPAPSDPLEVEGAEAHEWYLRGQHHFFRGGAEELAQARHWFRRAIEAEAAHAPAWAGLSRCASWAHLYHRTAADDLREAVAAGARAVALAPELAEARVARGLALSLEGRDVEAQEEFERALALNPKLFEARYLYGRFYYPRGLFDQAAEQFAAAEALRPEELQTPAMLAKSLLALGRQEESAAAHRRALALAEQRLKLDDADARALANGCRALIGLGERERCLRWAERARGRHAGHPTLFYTACACAQAKESDLALTCLEEIVDAGWADWRWLGGDPDLEPLREEARFRRLLERSDLEERPG